MPVTGRFAQSGRSITYIPRTNSSAAFRTDHGIYEVRFCLKGSSPRQMALQKSANSGEVLGF
jgi:hypothetical protein